jgi:hypothetical protein
MSAPFFRDIDWTRPWLIPLAPFARPILEASDWRKALNDAAASISNHRGLPIRFVPQADLPSGVPYEAFISDTGHVPTRDNLHDFFNALIWLTFPRIKVQLNALQAAEIARTNVAGPVATSTRPRRGSVRDAATIFDENAALVLTHDRVLIDALRSHDWHHVFVTRKDILPHDCEVRLFGHALMEKLVSPYKAITAHAWIVEVDKSFFIMDPAQKRHWIDERISGQLTPGLSTSAFTPLPVLGLPGWSEGQDENFYDDAAVFRPKRKLG